MVSKAAMVGMENSRPKKAIHSRHDGHVVGHGQDARHPKGPVKAEGHVNEDEAQAHQNRHYRVPAKLGANGRAHGLRGEDGGLEFRAEEAFQLQAFLASGKGGSFTENSL